MKENYYVLYLDEPASPGFCSLDKMYVGTESDLKIVADNMLDNQVYVETAEAIKKYFEGDRSVEHTIAYRKRKVLEPIKVAAEHVLNIEKLEWTHKNAWGFPYDMKAEKVKLQQIVFDYNGSVYRCIKGWFANLCYKGVGGAWNPLDGGFWGNAFILNVLRMQEPGSFVFNNILYVIEESYSSEIDKAILDMTIQEKIQLQGICDEIFADG